MQIRGEVRGVTVIDDFAHHPTAVRETLRALKAKYPARRLVAVFEPRSWSSRLAVFQEAYAQAFAAADETIISAVYNSASASLVGRTLDTAELAGDITAAGCPARVLDGADAIVSDLTPTLRTGDLVVIMSNGGFDRIHDKMLEQLKMQS